MLFFYTIWYNYIYKIYTKYLVNIKRAYNSKHTVGEKGKYGRKLPHVQFESCNS